MMSAHYPTDKGVAARVEELLREQLLELGEDPANLAPHLILQNMQCEVYPDESMVYIWKDIPILRVVPERTDTGVMSFYYFPLWDLAWLGATNSPRSFFTSFPSSTSLLGL